jgi:hypothetical protein
MPRERKYPDARLTLTVATENHDLESGVKQLNPILREILDSRGGPLTDPDLGVAKFGRLTFSSS